MENFNVSRCDGVEVATRICRNTELQQHKHNMYYILQATFRWFNPREREMEWSPAGRVFRMNTLQARGCAAQFSCEYSLNVPCHLYVNIILKLYNIWITWALVNIYACSLTDSRSENGPVHCDMHVPSHPRRELMGHISSCIPLRRASATYIQHIWSAEIEFKVVLLSWVWKRWQPKELFGVGQCLTD